MGLWERPTQKADVLLNALREGHTAALQIMLAETACDLQILACHLKKDGCHASGEREMTVNKACQEKWQSQDRKYEFLL